MLLANTLAPWLPFTPGFSAFAFELMIPMTVLAAMIERPFLSEAGLRKDVLWRSIRANSVSSLLGIITIMPATILAYSIGPLITPIAVAASVYVERACLIRSGPIDDRHVGTGMLVMGNVVSSVVLWLIPFIVFDLQDAVPDVRVTLAPYETWLRWMTVCACGVLIGWAFARPLIRRERHAVNGVEAGASAAGVGAVTSRVATR